MKYRKIPTRDFSTGTGIWVVSCDAKNRPVSFRDVSTGTLVECAYDYRGRRCTKKVTVAGTVTLHHRYIYRGYLQIACVDLTRSGHPALWFVLWDPSQETATRPLAIQKDGTWYTYGCDITKTSARFSGPPATSARATVTRRSARSPLPATSRNPSNGHRNTTTRKPHWSTTTSATTRPPWAGGFPATPSRNKAEGTSTPSSGIILGAAWTFSGSGVFGNASKDALVLNHRQTILRNIRWRWESHILEQSVSVSGTDICRSA